MEKDASANAEEADRPAWFRDVFKVFTDLVTEWEDVRETTVALTVGADGLARLSKVLGHDEESVKRSERIERVASAETDRGFTFLHSQGLVLTWAALETLVTDVVGGALLADRELLARDEIARIKVPAGEFLSADSDEERIAWLVHQLQRNAGSVLKSGVSRFEPMRAFVDLSGPCRPDLKQRMYELHQYRNLIAHKAGRVDAIFLKKCPGASEKIDDQLRIDPKKYHDLLRAAVEYATRIDARVAIQHGGTPEAGWEDVMDDPRAIAAESQPQEP